jgi:Flp pilus assembly protein TadG
VRLRRPSRAGRRSDRGAIAVLVATLALALVALLAFTTDFGVAYAQKQALRTGTDSAALAVARTQYRLQLKNPSRTCLQAKAADTALASSDANKSSTVALRQINANAPFGATVAPTDVTTTLGCVNPSTGSVCT